MREKLHEDDRAAAFSECRLHSCTPHGGVVLGGPREPVQQEPLQHRTCGTPNLTETEPERISWHWVPLVVPCSLCRQCRCAFTLLGGLV